MFGLARETFSIGTTIITILNIFLVILVVYIIKLISNHFSKVKQLEKDVLELKNERCNNENQNKK
jgi:biopolymer transport protein ExbB/TolQ